MRRNKKKGITLIEVIISIAILAVVIVPLSAMTITTNRKSEVSEERQKAATVGQQYLEEITAYSSTGITLDADDKFALLDNNANEKKLVATRNALGIVTSLNSNFNLRSDNPDTPYNVEIDLQRDANASYKQQDTITNETLDDDCDYVIKLCNNNVIEVNGISYSFSRSNYIMEINEDMELTINDDPSGTSASFIPRYPGNIKNKIKFKYDNGYDYNLNPIRYFEINSTYRDHDISIEKTFNRDELAGGNRLVDFNVESAYTTISVKNNVFTETNVREGDLYKINVIVRNEKGDTLFEGSSATNILIR